MQAQRKELERNALVTQLNRAYEGIKQGPSRSTVLFLTFVVGALLLFGVFRWFWVSSQASASNRWLQLDEVLFAEQLETLLKEKDLDNTPQHRLARFKEARLQLSQGLRRLGDISYRKESRQQIEEAAKTYDELAQTVGRVPLLHQEALWGAAKGYESLGGSENIDEAKKRYQRLAREYPTTALGKDAKKQVDRLDLESTQQNLRELNKEFSTGKGS
jgi:hypothetical protein